MTPGEHRVAVIGGGAQGIVLAAAAHRAGHRVTLCVRSPLDRVRLDGDGGSVEVPLRISTDPAEVGPVDWILLTTKAQDTAGAAGWLTELSGPDTVTVVVQNGVEQRSVVAPLLPTDAAILPAVSYISSERLAPGHVVHQRGAALRVPGDEHGVALRELLAGSDIEIEPVADFTTVAWLKLAGNAVANPITALTLRRLDVFHEPAMQPLAREVLAEVVAVARAEGAALPDDTADAVLAQLRGLNTAVGSSMLQDRLAGRATEHEYLNGVVVRAADRHGIEVPLNRALLALLRTADRPS